MAATVDTITLDSGVPHNFGAVTRWLVMYPSPPHLVVQRHWSINQKCTPSSQTVQFQRDGNVGLGTWLRQDTQPAVNQ